ncbi:flagellar hook-basal body complex protein FliE [Nocardioides sp. Kera G14]|uniref:flagellar hook-basal body complex protein FliE n=1 Tax=Nocardioides sp. Kera G14 TaxID=2884264 RepID=UPI001D11EFB3|nr:flagellar hook-basal body complex protein FliE [Nocardioides sp. Kera G14]UDY24071.1 flagellar hook-basal body complex protein FliE [Nocardioides sp. Kera G14]
MSISGIEAVSGFSPSNFLSIGDTDATASTSATSATGATGTDFSAMLGEGIDSLEAKTDKAADLSVKAATGDLSSIHDYTIAASEAQLATQLTTAVRDKAVSAFQQIMQMTV